MTGAGLMATLRSWLSGPQATPRNRFTATGVAATHPGLLRPDNQDAAVWIGGDAGAGDLAVLADGMGGHKGGIVASSTALRIIPEVYYAFSGEPASALLHAIAEANRHIYEQSLRSADLEGMGTTCVALAIRGGQAWLAWIGDSRLYLLRGGRLYQMSEDHSLVTEMVRAGELTLEEARNHEDRNVLRRALGTNVEAGPSCWSSPSELRGGDRFLLCSDGLHDMLTDEAILELALSGSPEHSATALIDAALAQGGYDNISVVLVEVTESEPEAA